MGIEQTGTCKHGTFLLLDGCPQCIADRMGEEGNTKASIAETIEAVQPKAIVKVKYYSETTGEASDREYTYYSVDRVKVGDIIMVPVRDTTGKAKVSAIDVPEAEIASFKDKVKTIPTGSMVTTPPESAPITEGLTTGKRLQITETLIEESQSVAVLRPGEDAEARGWYLESVALLIYAENRTITTTEDNEGANNDLSIISKLKKAMESKKKSLLEPLKAQSDAIRDTYNYLMSPVFEADKLTRDKMLAYDAEQRRIRFEQEEINRKRLEAAQAEMRLKGELSESTNLIKLNEEQRPTVTELGTSGMTAHWKYEVTDFTLLPDEYKVIDNAQLSAIAKSHHDKKQVPGVRFYNEPGITNRAR